MLLYDTNRLEPIYASNYSHSIVAGGLDVMS